MTGMTEEEMTTKKSVNRQAYEGAMERVIDFVVDTVTVDKAAGAAAYFRNGNFTVGQNTITSNYVVDKDNNQYNQSRETLTHEQKHRDNYLRGMYAYAVSPDQAYKREMHDEISANIAELISLREEYIRTGDISVFDKMRRFSFYKEAIEKGEIKPNSPYQEDFDKEMRLIVNGTQKMWMEKYGNDFYIDNGVYHCLAEGDFEGKYAEYWDKNYQNALKIAYNIGGVDFTKYMDKDVEIPQGANAKIAEGLSKFQSYYKEKNSLLTDDVVNKIIFEESGFPPYDGTISLYEYKQLLQHQMALNNFASGQVMFNDVTSETKTYSKEEYLKSLNSKETIDKYKKMYEEMLSPKVSNADEMKKTFPTFETFRKYMQSFEAKDYQEKFNEATRNEAFIDKIVEYQAAEYAKTGKDFPQNNRQNYQKALNKLYCGAYDILKPDETKLKSELSYSADKLQNSSAWERTMASYLKSVGLSPEDAEYKAHNLAQENKIIGGWACFVGGPLVGACNKVKDLKHRMTHIVDENGEEQNVGLWGKIKHKAKQIKEDLTTYREIDEEDGGEWVGKCSIWKGIGRKISSWFKQEHVKNEPVKPVNTQDPQYPKWSKDKRVSDVQYRKILDLTKPIIKQPTQSKTDHQQENTSVKTATTVKMKSDIKKAQVASGQLKKKNTSSKDRATLKSAMKQDKNNAQKMTQNIGNQKTTIKKVAKIGQKPPSQKQVFKALYDKVFGR